MSASQAKRTKAQSTSFETLYAVHHRAVLAYCARRTSRANAWDAASEVFLVAWRRLDKVPQGDGTRPWLFGVAYKTLANQRRGEKRRRRLSERLSGLPDADPGLGPELQIVRNEEEREVVSALDRLRDIDREIITLSLWEELPPIEIASALGISRAAVDKRLERAKRRLSDELDRTTQDRATHEPIEEGGVA